MIEKELVQNLKKEYHMNINGRNGVVVVRGDFETLPDPSERVEKKDTNIVEPEQINNFSKTHFHVCNDPNVPTPGNPGCGQ